MARLNLVLFGGFRATIGARYVPLTLKKAQALLAFLALSPAQRQTRERLAALLWADAPDEHARNSLRQTLFAIRSALGPAAPHVLGSDAAAVWLEPGAHEVVFRFEPASFALGLRISLTALALVIVVLVRPSLRYRGERG